MPSNLALHKFGARRWIARIVITWDILAIAMAWLSGTTSFYALSFLLGAAEAGFFPGVLLYMTYWFLQEARARTMATFTLSSVLSLVIGAPLSGAILTLGGQDGFKGWPWRFVLESIPAVLLGFATLFALSDKPNDARCLAAGERDWLGRTLQAEAASRPAEASMTALEALKNHRTLTLAFVIMLNIVAIYGISLWLPQIVKSVGVPSNLQVGFVTAIPFACTAVVMLITGTHADRTGERRSHILVPALIGGDGLVLAAPSSSPVVSLVGICFAAMGIWCSNTVFWTMPMRIFSGVSAAASLGLINSISKFGGFIGPYLTDWIRQMSGAYPAALTTLGASLAIFGVVMFVFLSAAGRTTVPKAMPARQ